MFYFYAILLTLYNWLIYAIFRSTIYNSLRLSKMSKTHIRKNCKGFMNYWFYTQLHQEKNLGFLYYANIIFLIFLLLFSIISIFFGYLEVLKIPITLASSVLCLFEIPILIWCSKIDALTEYGKTFVFLRKRKESVGYYSSLLYIFSWVIPVTFTFLCIRAL